MSKFKLHTPLELRRSVSNVDFITGASSSLEDIKASIGKVYTEKGFSSTSLTGFAPDAFGMGDNQTILEIIAPTHTKGAFIYKISEHSPEFEFLIDKDTSFKILDAGEREIEIKDFKGKIVKKKQRYMQLQVI